MSICSRIKICDPRNRTIHLWMCMSMVKLPTGQVHCYAPLSFPDWSSMTCSSLWIIIIVVIYGWRQKQARV
jgi:hypothetical protein